MNRFAFYIRKVYSFFSPLVTETLKTSWVLFRIMIPVSIVVKILQELDLIKYIGIALYPMMKYVGLPGEMGFVWGTGMITNLFGGIIAYLSLAPTLLHPLSVAQITILSSMMLIAHSFPVELQIASKSGSRLITMFVIRFGFAFVYGMILHAVFTLLHVCRDIPVINLAAQKAARPGILFWLLSEVRHYLMIMLFIFSLLTLIKLMTKAGLINLLTRVLNPVLSKMGIGKNATPITIIGLTLGITYGGALIIEQSKTLGITKKEVLFSMVLMGLCHSLIEDTLLMFSLGSSFTVILFGRLIFALLITWLFVKLSKKLSDKAFGFIFLNKR